MDIDSARLNERVRSLANLGDNSALALFIAGVARAFNEGNIDYLVVGAFLLGFVFIWMSWHIRGLLQSEE